MSLAHGSSIVRDGLVLCLDAANSKSIRKRTSNLLSWNSWTLGSGSVTGYTQNGSTAENQRILDTNPFGNSDVVWDTPSNDVESGGDGGWDGSIISNIDPTKTYRWSTWVRRKVIGNGSFYLGCYGYDSSNNNVGVLNRSNGSVNTNPYFVASGWWGTANTWYLVVGHVWPTGSGTGSSHVDSGIYNTAGTKVTSAGDFVWQSTNVKTTLRSYLYYSTDTSTNQQWYHPRLDICDGSEPTISELLNNIENTWYDLSGNGNHGTLTNGPTYNSINGGCIVFDGSDDYVSFKNPLNQSQLNQVWTIQGWINISSKPSQYFIAGLNSGVFIEYSQGNNSLLYLNSGTNDYYTYGGQFTNQGWVFCTFRFNNATGDRQIWRNTTNISTGGPNNTYTPSGQSSTFTLGANGSATISGKVSNLLFYNKYLIDSEIAQNFAAHRGRYGI